MQPVHVARVPVLQEAVVNLFPVVGPNLNPLAWVEPLAKD